MAALGGSNNAANTTTGSAATTAVDTAKTLTYGGTIRLTAAQNMAKENEGYSGLSTSVESAYKVGSTVVNEILKGWATYRDHPPAAPGP